MKWIQFTHIGLYGSSQLEAVYKSETQYPCQIHRIHNNPDLLLLMYPTGSQPHFLVKLLYDNKGDICS